MVQVYREVGERIRMPSVVREFAELDSLVVKIEREGALDDELRTAWAELRELF